MFSFLGKRKAVPAPITTADSDSAYSGSSSPTSESSAPSSDGDADEDALEPVAELPRHRRKRRKNYRESDSDSDSAASHGSGSPSEASVPAPSPSSPDHDYDIDATDISDTADPDYGPPSAISDPSYKSSLGTCAGQDTPLSPDFRDPFSSPDSPAAPRRKALAISIDTRRPRRLGAMTATPSPISPLPQQTLAARAVDRHRRSGAPSPEPRSAALRALVECRDYALEAVGGKRNRWVNLGGGFRYAPGP